MLPHSKRAELGATPFFAALNVSTSNQLLNELTLVRLHGGEILFRAGVAGDSMYLLLSGRLRVSLERGDGAVETIRELSRGETVGELALLTGAPRSATVQAIRDSELARLSRASFERAIRSDPALLGQIAMQLADRQRQDSQASLSRRSLRTIAILPWDENKIRFSDFAAALSDAMTSAGPTLLLNRDSYQTICGSTLTFDSTVDDGNSSLAARLNDLESHHRFILYQGAGDTEDWTKLCARQADLTLLVGAADAELPTARLDELRRGLDGGGIAAQIELVLLHETGGHAPLSSARRLSSSRLGAHHHVTVGNRRDLERLVRLFTGSAIGLVLSGGGARGFAHIGVIRALTEKNIPIDFIGGTSMGAVIAAQHALGWDWQTMARINREEWPRCQPEKNYTLPLVAINSGKRMDQMLMRMFGAVEIENLHRPFFCVSTNLTSAGAKLHQRGSLWKAVRASVSIPGIGPPAIENGEILVDGGLVDNLPVESMKKLCQGQVYAVDVSEQVEFRSALKESYTVSGWKLLWQRLNPFAAQPDLPNILNTLYRITTVAGIRASASAKALADLCFEPPVGQFGVFEWQSVENIIEVGYRYAREKLDQRAKSRPD